MHGEHAVLGEAQGQKNLKATSASEARKGQMNGGGAGGCPDSIGGPSPGPALGSTVGTKDRSHPGRGVGLGCSGLHSRPCEVLPIVGRHEVS